MIFYSYKNTRIIRNSKSIFGGIKEETASLFSHSQCEGDGGAGFGIGEGVVVVFEVVAAGCGDGVQLVIFEVAEPAARGLQGAAEAIVGPIHLIDLHYGT